MKLVSTLSASSSWKTDNKPVPTVSVRLQKVCLYWLLSCVVCTSLNPAHHWRQYQSNYHQPVCSSAISVNPSLPSDHYVVSCTLAVPRPPKAKKLMEYRKLRNIDIEQFQHDITTSQLVINPADDLDELISQYNKTLSDLLDQHAPMIKRMVTVRPNTSWYSDEIRKEKCTRRRLEWEWRKTGLHVHRQLYIQQCQHVNSLSWKAKVEYNRNRIANCDQKELFKVVKKMTQGERVLPEYDNPAVLSEEFNTCFIRKIEKIRQDLEDHVDTGVIHPTNIEQSQQGAKLQFSTCVR